jgi:predicted transcriptional regulator
MNELMNDIQKRINELGSQSAYAKLLGVSDVMVSLVVNGKKQPSQAMLDDLGYEKVRVSTYTYTKK